MSGAPVDERRSMATLVVDIVDNIRAMVRGELRLAARDLSREAAKVRRGATLLMVGAVVLALAGGVFLVAAVSALALMRPTWMAALVVGLATALCGGVVMAVGVQQLSNLHVLPPETANRLQENVQWAKHQIK